MIGSSRHDAAIAALQAEIAALRDGLAWLGTQVAILSARLETGLERQAMATGEWARVGDRLDRLDAAMTARAEAQASTAAGQAEALAALESAGALAATAVAALVTQGDEHAEAIRQLRADIVRLGRQAASDLHEMRETHAALAELMLARAPSAAGSLSPGDG